MLYQRTALTAESTTLHIWRSEGKWLHQRSTWYHMYILASTLLILFTPPIFAQNFSIPKGWTVSTSISYLSAKLESDQPTKNTEYGCSFISGSTIKTSSGPSWHGRSFVWSEHGSYRGYGSCSNSTGYFDWLIFDEDLDYGQNANLLSATANFDSITLGQVYSRLLTDRFKIASERLIPTM